MSKTYVFDTSIPDYENVELNQRKILVTETTVNTMEYSMYIKDKLTELDSLNKQKTSIESRINIITQELLDIESQLQVDITEI